jgi:hypothetical protein
MVTFVKHRSSGFQNGYALDQLIPRILDIDYTLTSTIPPPQADMVMTPKLSPKKQSPKLKSKENSPIEEEKKVSSSAKKAPDNEHSPQPSPP